ncbi:enolase-phosphatase E1 [Zeugodacus cucurbitae]|uniref:Enolase-phosphatase E1 n=1 Tax=Zeugodacus cucurbitae TaxID=28588 RepID=A0A0A1XCD7_ZEUCU|nr:enolase-phosphatase E1 [Zeugodacus cucurbitae]XP_054081409.1 enolase-phosphatase E1 [Zeugodacus cucurbitae]
MPEFTVKLILSDIEGTTTSISFVKDVLFPYAKAHSKAFLEETWDDAETQRIVQDLRKLPQYKEYLGVGDEQPTASLVNVASFVKYLIEKDLKLGPLKTLQGLVWAKGYENGNIKGHIYDDVLPAFKRWHEAGIRIAIYSSGSVKAQQLLFGQTEMGNLLPYISGHYDTAVGHKQQKESYVNIARDLDLLAEDILFLTDIVKEAEAAHDAGMQAVLLNRPGNAPLTDDDKTAFTFVDNFDNLKINLKK